MFNNALLNGIIFIDILSVWEMFLCWDYDGFYLKEVAYVR